MTFDQKTKDTMMWSAVYNAGASAVESVIGNIAFSALLGYSISAAGGVVNALVNGAIIGAVMGYVLAQWYPQVMQLQAKYLGNKFSSLFKILFYPYLIGAALSLLTSVGFSSIVGVAPLVAVVGTVATRYAYAKLLTAKVGQYYPAQQ